MPMAIPQRWHQVRGLSNARKRYTCVSSPPHATPSLPGWLSFVVDPATGRKRARYVVLAPRFVSLFESEDDAAISEEGFLMGLAAAASAEAVLAGTGVMVLLENLKAAQPGVVDDKTQRVQFTLCLREAVLLAHAKDDGGESGAATDAVVFECPSREIVDGWCGAIVSQLGRFADVPVPPRVLTADGTRGLNPAPPSPKRSVGAQGAGASPSASAAFASVRSAAAAGAQAIGRSFTALMGSLGPSPGGTTAGHLVRYESDYSCHSYWEGKGIDLASDIARNVREDEHGHPAAVLHGWLTKRNKTGLRVGQVEKERYFVLTPFALNFFPDDSSADVKGGYMWGETGGKSISGVFRKTGARLPLEAVCEVRLLAKEEYSRQVAVAAQAVGDAAPLHSKEVVNALTPVAVGSSAAAVAQAAEEVEGGEQRRSGRRAVAREEEEGVGGGGDGEEQEGGGKARRAKEKERRKAAAREDSGDSGAADGGGVLLPPPAPPPKPTTPRPKPTEPKPATPAAAPPPPPALAPAQMSAVASNGLIELDFGDFSLVVNAHSQRTRATWVSALRKWSAFRKRVLDEDYLAGRNRQ